jgi:GPI ethanolamine phosphate transferase 1
LPFLDASLNDKWVFEHVVELFNRAKKDVSLNRKLREDNVLFSLHFLGPDTNGHVYSPHSKEYYDNIRLIDRYIHDLEHLIESFYGNDGRTAFVFSSDHGMSDRGNHGDGDPDCTRTPIVAWGAGIQASSSPVRGKGHDEFSRNWGLADYERKDIGQADVAALVSALMGIHFPVNSIGVLPIHYLNVSEPYKSAVLFANARGILLQYVQKGKSRRRQDRFFSSYPPLAEELLDRSLISEEIGRSIAQGNFELALSKSHQLIRLSLAGLSYLQTYDQTLLVTIITCGYLGLFTLGCKFILNQMKNVNQPSANALRTRQRVFQSGMPLLVFLILSVLFGIYLYQRGSPWRYYAYASMPILFATNLVQDLGFFHDIYDLWGRYRATILFPIGCHLLVIQMIVLAYFYRPLLSGCLLVLNVWSWYHYSLLPVPSGLLATQWNLMILVIAIFPALPIDNRENLFYTVIGSFLLIGLSVLTFLDRKSSKIHQVSSSDLLKKRLFTSYYLLLYSVCLCLAVFTTCHSTRRFRSKSGLPALNQYLSWGLSGLSLSTLIISGLVLRMEPKERLMEIIIALGVPYTFLNASYELIFYVFLGCLLLLWIKIEHLGNTHHKEVSPDIPQTVVQPSQKFMRLDDFRLASWLLTLFALSFFGTGNVASVSSFTLSSVYRFVTIFSPFLMGALLVFKLLLPSFLVYSAFWLVTGVRYQKPDSIFVLIMTTSSLAVVQFFYRVTNEGSWLDIGISISHFFIASSLMVLMLFLYGFTKILVGRVSFDSSSMFPTSYVELKSV